MALVIACALLSVPVLAICCVYFFRKRPRLDAALPRGAGAAVPQLSDAQPLETTENIRIRIPLATELITALPVALLIAFSLMLASIDGVHSGRSLTVFSIAMGALLALMITLDRWFGVALTPQGADVHNFRARRLAWGAVHAVTQETRFGSRRVVLWTEGGYRIPLRAPVMALPNVGRGRFDRDFDTIGQWWLVHRWGPDPATTL